MSLVLYNTLNGGKEQFKPLEEGRVKLYVCGPTVYDESHIGHARSAIVFDVLVRHLLDLGYQVTYVRNFTDIDDKIINRAREAGVDCRDLAEKYIRSYHEDLDALGALRPDFEPRATEFIDRMLDDVQALMHKGVAYLVGGDVYYEVARFPEYGRLSGRNIEEMQAGARVDVDERKKSPMDFALWKESKDHEPSWPTPWGIPGRPGWHIECSAMSNCLLGQVFDIHGGGHDLIFPHHENEMAQSMALGRPFARYWVHNGFVRVDHQKMSKSLKNFFTIKEVLRNFKPEVLRLFLLSKHYRGPIDFSDEGLRETQRGLDRAYRALEGAGELGATPAPAPGPETREIRDLFRDAMNDDLNTSKALGHLFEAVKEVNRLLDEARAGRTDPAALGSWLAAVRGMSRTLGILEQDPNQWFTEAVREDEADLTPDKIEALIQARTEARKARNWAEADRIRDELKAAGVVLEDAGGQTRWRLEA
ncbi:MAG: cysteine--tRNA ligase [Pseudomonadota bacterium]